MSTDPNIEIISFIWVHLLPTYPDSRDWPILPRKAAAPQIRLSRRFGGHAPIALTVLRCEPSCYQLGGCGLGMEVNHGGEMLDQRETAKRVQGEDENKASGVRRPECRGSAHFRFEPCPFAEAV
jgi:hypothetical protein